MNILVHLSNTVLNSAVADVIRDNLKVTHTVCTPSDDARSKGVDLIIVDSHTITDKMLFRYPKAKAVLMDTACNQQDLIRLMVSHRVAGIISATSDVPLFIKAIEAVHRGELWIGHDTVKALLENNDMIASNGAGQELSQREREIVNHICKGHTNREIAARLSLSEQTIKAHLNRIYRKFNVKSRSKLIAVAMRPSA